MHTRKFVANRRDEGQNWKFCSDITGRVACPIDLRIAETKSVLQKIPRDRGNVALPPAPVIDVRLINENQPRRHREKTDYNHELRRSVIARRCSKSFRGWKQVSASRRFASPLAQGERTEVRGFCHSIDVPDQILTQTSLLRRGFYLAPKAISQTSLGHRPRN